MAVPDQAYTAIGVSSLQGEDVLVMINIDETGRVTDEVALNPKVNCTAKTEYLQKVQEILAKVVQ